VRIPSGSWKCALIAGVCRCDAAKKLLQPGEKATVEAELSTERLNARQEHRFTVLASDGGEVMTNSLKLTGYVRRD
jgi:hypothetical protein